MKIIFLNVWGNEMRDELVSYIATQAEDTDIFCFQEATEAMKRRCADVLVGYEEISGYKYISDDENFSQSIFIKHTVKKISSGTLLVDDMTSGLATYAHIETGGSRMFICNVHGRSRPREKLDTLDRLRFSKNLIDFFKDTDEPVVIGGDFNLDYHSESIALFQSRRYRNLIKDFSIGTTRNHFAWDKYPGDEMYYSDYVFLNDATRLKTFTVQNNAVSDHLPMILQVNIKQGVGHRFLQRARQHQRKLKI